MSEPRIDREDFAAQFASAVDAALAFATSMVSAPLPSRALFLIEPNASYDDGTAPAPDERRFPAETLSPRAVLAPMTSTEAIDWLWRDGRVPQWIDVSVAAVDARTTYVRLTCCGRFRGRRDALYYQDANPPFGIKSPSLPADLPIDWDARSAPRRFALPEFPHGITFGTVVD